MQCQIYQQMLREDLLTDPGVGEQIHYNCLMTMYAVQMAHHSSGTTAAATLVCQVLMNRTHYDYVHAYVCRWHVTIAATLVFHQRTTPSHALTSWKALESVLTLCFSMYLCRLQLANLQVIGRRHQ